MKLHNDTADLFIPDDTAVSAALARTTHLGICAHQDDLEFMAYHGIAACFEKTDVWFSGIVITNGAGSARKGRYANYTDAQMVATRREEQRHAARLGKYAAIAQLDYSSEQTKNPNNTAIDDDIFALLEAMTPTVVYLHNPADKHDSHVATMAHALRALRRLPKEKRPKKIYGCEVWRNLDWLVESDKVRQDVSAFPDLAHKISAVFDSQIAGGKRYDLAVEGRRFSNATFDDAHATDETTALQWAMDMTPLIENDALTIENFTLHFIENFKNDITARLKKFC